MGYQFEDSEELAMLRESVRKFAEQEIGPEAHKLDEREEFSVPLTRKMGELGLFGTIIDPKYGGHGLDYISYIVCVEELARVDGSQSATVAAHNSLGAGPLYYYGNEEQKEQWLKPLLAGEIRSCFSMTEPDVASSDATNIQCEIRREGDEYVINGTKWWSSGAMADSCKIAIVMGKSNPDAPKHLQQSMILVPLDTPGVTIVRDLHVFGYDHAPHGHAEIKYENVRVPVSNMLLGEGRGFEIAQGRLGPGRIHHCMRSIGVAERALEAMCRRAAERVAFGKPLYKHGSTSENIAKSRCEIDQARLLTIMAARSMDQFGNKVARQQIAMIKAVAPTMLCNVLDRAIQVHGAAGVCQDTFLASAYAKARTLRLADGPDEVHLGTIAKLEMSRYL